MAIETQVNRMDLFIFSLFSLRTDLQPVVCVCVCVRACDIDILKAYRQLFCIVSLNLGLPDISSSVGSG